MIIRNYLFHRVTDTNKNWAPALDLKTFEKCVKYISKNYDVHIIEDLLLNEHPIKNTSKKLACITFDDGFKDNIEFALPILSKYNVKATFYITTDCIDNNEVTWTHTFPHAFQTTTINNLILDFDFLEPYFRNKEFISNEDRISFGAELYETLKTISYENTIIVVDEILKQFNDVEKPINYMMDWDDIRHLQTNGHQINSHTKSHPFLAQIETDALLEQELSHSLNRIQTECGVKPRSISYPVGVFDERVKIKAKECGYELGLAVNQVFCDTNTMDLMEIPRMDIYANSSWLKTYFRLNGQIEKLKKFLKK